MRDAALALTVLTGLVCMAVGVIWIRKAVSTARRFDWTGP